MRLDQYLVEKKLTSSRTKAQELIRAGFVCVNGHVIQKPALSVSADDDVSVSGALYPWVSRGGVKLAYALSHFDLAPSGVTALDIGASTGGFTDVLLQNGAKKIYAVDVGHGQLDEKIRQDTHVVVLEKTNARQLTSELIPDPIDWIVCDASFISLKLVLPVAMDLTNEGAVLIALIKPQFEVGKGRLGKDGVVRDSHQHAEVCEGIHEWLESRDWRVQGLTESPIEGGKGNKEFLIFAVKRS